MYTSNNIIRGDTLYGRGVGLCGATMHFALVDKLKLFDGWSIVNMASTNYSDIELVVLTLYRDNHYISVLQHAISSLNDSRYYYVQSICVRPYDAYTVNDCFASLLDGCNQNFDVCVDSIVARIGDAIKGLA